MGRRAAAVARRRLRALRRHAPQHRADPRQQLAHVDGLGEVVVGAHLEADDAVDHLAGRGQHHDPDLDVGAQIAGERQPVLARHVDVEDHEIGRALLEDPAHRDAVLGGAHGEARVLQIVASISQISGSSSTTTMWLGTAIRAHSARVHEPFETVARATDFKPEKCSPLTRRGKTNAAAGACAAPAACAGEPRALRSGRAMPDSQERVLTRTYSLLAAASVVPLLIVILLLDLVPAQRAARPAARGARGAGGRAQHPAQQHHQDGSGPRPHARRLGRDLLERARSGAPAAGRAAGAAHGRRRRPAGPGRGARRAAGRRGRGAPRRAPVTPHAAVASGDALSALELLPLGARRPAERGAVRRGPELRLARCARPGRTRSSRASPTIRSRRCSPVTPAAAVAERWTEAYDDPGGAGWAVAYATPDHRRRRAARRGRPRRC